MSKESKTYVINMRNQKIPLTITRNVNDQKEENKAVKLGPLSHRNIELSPLLLGGNEEEKVIMKAITEENKKLLEKYRKDPFWRNFRNNFEELENSLNKLSPHQNAVILRATKILLQENQALRAIFASDEDYKNNEYRLFEKDLKSDESKSLSIFGISLFITLCTEIPGIVLLCLKEKNDKYEMIGGLLLFSSFLILGTGLCLSRNQSTINVQKRIEENKETITEKICNLFNDISDIYIKLLDEKKLDLLLDEAEKDMEEKKEVADDFSKNQFPQELKDMIMEFCHNIFLSDNFELIINKIFNEELNKGLSLQPSVKPAEQDGEAVLSRVVVGHNNHIQEI